MYVSGWVIILTKLLFLKWDKLKFINIHEIDWHQIDKYVWTGQKSVDIYEITEYSWTWLESLNFKKYAYEKLICMNWNNLQMINDYASNW